MARENLTVVMIKMKEDEELPELPEILAIQKKQDEKELKVPEIKKREEKEKESENETKEKKRGKVDINDFTNKVKSKVQLDSYRDEVEQKILSLIKEGRALLIGDNIGSFCEKIIRKTELPLRARDTSPTYISPRTEIKDEEILRALDIKQFKLEELQSMTEKYYNIIIFFGLKKQDATDREMIIKKCKELLLKNGQILLVEEFISSNIVIALIDLLRLGLQAVYRKIKKINFHMPLFSVNKLVDKQGLKKSKIGELAQGRIRMFIVAKRLSALIT